MKIRRLFLSLFSMVLVAVIIQTARAEEVASGVTIAGDFRYRHDLIDAENKPVRNRERLRARLSLSARLNDEVKLGFQVASGSDSPISANQTLTGGFSSKSLMLDLAYFDWRPQMIDGISVLGGKIKTPFHAPGKTELLWDNDLRPEGITATYSYTRGPTGMFVTTSYLWVEERKEHDDAVLLGSQTGVTYTSSPVDLLFGLGYFNYRNSRHYPSFFNPGNGYGNSVDADGRYLFGFDELEVFSEIAFPGIINDVSVFFDYVANVAEDVDANQGWLAGFLLGVCKDPGSFALLYSYRDVEKDAIIGAFTSSDFLGGGSGTRGHETNLEYQITRNIKGVASYYFGKTGGNTESDYHALQFDMNFAF